MRKRLFCNSQRSNKYNETTQVCNVAWSSSGVNKLDCRESRIQDIVHCDHRESRIRINECLAHCILLFLRSLTLTSFSSFLFVSFISSALLGLDRMTGENLNLSYQSFLTLSGTDLHFWSVSCSSGLIFGTLLRFSASQLSHNST